MIEIKKLTKTFGSLVAVDHLDLFIGAGDIFGFIGPNGAGKTTSMRILVTLLYAMKDLGKQRGLASLCIGGGEAVALVVER